MHSINPGDIKDVIRIAEECGLSPWSPNDYALETRRNDSTLLRLEDEKQETVGFLVGRRVPSASSETLYDAEIYNIGVSKRFQRSGCGSLLLKEFLKRCSFEIVQTVWLDVRTSNSGAISFYTRFGFSEHTVRSRFYGDPVEDGMVMKLTLSERIY